MIPSKIGVFPDVGPDKEFAEFLRKDVFKIQHCADCQRHIFYPRIICPHCGSQQLSWVVASGQGLVYSTSVPRGMQEGEYNIALIDLAEGPRMMSRVVGVSPEKVAIGMKVTAFIGEVDNVRLVLFKPSEITQ